MKNKELITKLGLQKLVENENYMTGDFHQALLDIAYEDWQEHDAALRFEVFVRRGEDRVKDVIWTGTREELDKWWGEQAKTRSEEMSRWNTRLADGQSEWGYDEMLENAREKYGELFYVLTMVGKYNQQIGNGGHLQYFDNGYGGRNGRDNDPGIPLHREMTAEFERTIVPLVGDAGRDAVGKALDIMKALRIHIDDERETEEPCDECYGSGEVDRGEDGEYVKCQECGGRGKYTVDNDNYGCVVNGNYLDKLDTRWYEIENDAMTALNDAVMNAIIPLDGGAAAFISMARHSFGLTFDETQEKPEMIMPVAEDAVPATGDDGIRCYRMLVKEKLEYAYLENVTHNGIVTGYRKNRVLIADDGTYEIINGMKVGDEIDYWKDVADRFDEDGDDGLLRQDIRERYDKVLSDYVGYGKLQPLVEDDNGNIITYGYKKIAD